MGKRFKSAGLVTQALTSVRVARAEHTGLPEITRFKTLTVTFFHTVFANAKAVLFLAVIGTNAFIIDTHMPVCTNLAAASFGVLRGVEIKVHRICVVCTKIFGIFFSHGTVDFDQEVGGIGSRHDVFTNGWRDVLNGNDEDIGIDAKRCYGKTGERRFGQFGVDDLLFILDG